MAKLSLPFRGSGVDYSRLSAIERFVKKGRKFIGAGSSDVRVGEMEEYAPAEISLGINGAYNIPAGYQLGITIKQDIEAMGGMDVSPGGEDIVISCAGKYMTGDIIIQPVSNLRPDTIKYGVVIGEGEGAVTGTCQGFFD